MTEDLYGLGGRPFGPEIDAAFYFEGRAQGRALSWLAYGLADGNAVLTILGVPGAGKSMLGAHLAATVEPERVSAASLSARAIADGGLLAAVAAAFGLQAGSDDARAALEIFFQDAARAGRRCVLMIDDAQHFSSLALDEIATLASFRLGGQALLHTILLARPDFAAAIAARAPGCVLRASLEKVHRLGLLDADEIEPYIERRLRQAGWRGTPALEPTLFQDIHTASGGNPGRINRICDRLLLLGAIDQRALIDHAMFDAVIGELGSEFASADADTGAGDRLRPEADIMARLASQEEQIQQLRHALSALEVPASRTSPETDRIAALEDRIAALEVAMRDQERAICQALTTLIDWAEADSAQRFAA